jgi:hypothetical protein
VIYKAFVPDVLGPLPAQVFIIQVFGVRSPENVHSVFDDSNVVEYRVT